MNTSLGSYEYPSIKSKNQLGIGTYLSNNITNNDLLIKPLNVVIKVSQVYYNGVWLDLIKLSDSMGKHTGKIEQIELCKKILNIPNITYNHNPAGNELDKPKINQID